MAKEAVLGFYEKLQKDTALQEKIKAAEKSYAGDKEDRETIAKEIILPIAKAAGFDISLDDIKEYEKNLYKEGEVSDGELQQVAGGSSIGFCVVYGVGKGGKSDFAGCFLAGVLG
jgi:predicted ribosomally synthesized peptide with nif11-like leader